MARHLEREHVGIRTPARDRECSIEPFRDVLVDAKAQIKDEPEPRTRADKRRARRAG